MEDMNKNAREEELIQRVEMAAERGASKGRVKSGILASIPTLIILGLVALLIIPKVFALNDGLKYFFRTEAPVDDHDLTIENRGVLGYTAVDFEEAILGDSQKVKKLQVFQQEVSDVATQTDTGLFNLSAFTKAKIITYNGTAIYTVDLSDLKKTDISFDEKQRIVTLRIPHAQQEKINIPEDEIQFGDTTRGLLAFGDIRMTPEQLSDVQEGARNKMQEKLAEQNVQETADRFAKLAVWEMFSPIIKAVGKDVSLEVEFR